MKGRTPRKQQVAHRISQLRKALEVDTQHIRVKTIKQLEELFDLASGFAKGSYRFQQVDGRRKPVTVKQRQVWARIAAYIAQIMSSIADGIDTRQIDEDLAQLERLVDEANAKSQATEVNEKDRAKERPAKPAE